MQVSFSPAEIIELAQSSKTRGATQQTVSGISALETAQPGDLSFLGNAKYRSAVASTRASVVLCPLDYEGEPQSDQLFVFVENPSIALARLCSRIERLLWPRPTPGIHPTACVASSAKIAASATVGPLCVVEDGGVIGERTHLQAQTFIGRNAQIGEDCWLMPGVVIETECVLKNRIRLHPGVVIGSDGFGYEFAGGRHEKVPQVGVVLLENDVEIGSNSTVDRARFSRTVIGEGTKIDNLVQIGHNVVIGKHCLLCAQVGVSGSSTLSDYVVLGGQVGVAGHITIGKGVKVGGQAGINADVEPGIFLNGTPAIPYMLERRITVLQRKLPELFKRVDVLEEQIKKSSS
jgi:UDP-3-O-[3-hydroxymyristoyl] glucosamine N-acyltransferase